MRALMKTLAASCAVAVLSALPALAAGGEAAGGGHGEAAKGGLPQMNAETFPSQIFWLVVTFAFLYFVMSRIAAPRIATVIEERRDRVADDLDRAAEFKAQAEAAIKAYEKAVADARAKARAVSDETRRKAKVEADRRRADMDAKLADELSAAEARIASRKAAVLSGLKALAAEAATAAVQRLTTISVAPGEAEAAVDAALKR